jgi:hypothetical protein
MNFVILSGAKNPCISLRREETFFVANSFL